MIALLMVAVSTLVRHADVPGDVREMRFRYGPPVEIVSGRETTLTWSDLDDDKRAGLHRDGIRRILVVVTPDGVTIHVTEVNP